MKLQYSGYVAGIIALCGAAVAVHSETATRPRPKTALSPAALQEIAAVEAEINRIEAATLSRAAAESLDRSQQVALLGKLIFYDRNLSVQRNEACAFCHMPETGFSGAVSTLNQTTVAYPGSIRTRFSARRPQTHTYASYTPVLHYNALQGDLVGGAFWDMRATGLRLNSPLAEQAQGPPVNPVEMGLADPACMVYRASERPYRAMAERVWGAQASVIHWPADIDEVCNRPGPASGDDPQPVHLTPVDRGIAQATFDQVAQAIATFESSTEVNPFSSKFDYVMAGKAAFTADEKAGYDLFRSKTTHCNECHRDGGPGEEPLFTDFTASNLGLPANLAMPFYSETMPDQLGYTANPLGANFLDPGVGGFLDSSLNPDRQWKGAWQIISRQVQNADAAQRGQKAAARFRQSVYAQRISEVAARGGPFLQHARHAAAMQCGRPGREGNVLAGAGISRNDESAAARQPGLEPQAGGPDGRILEDLVRRVHTDRQISKMQLHPPARTTAARRSEPARVAGDSRPAAIPLERGIASMEMWP